MGAPRGSNGRRTGRGEWRRNWTVSWAAAEDGVWPAPLHRPKGDLWASGWDEAATIEADLEGISVAEILAGRIDPVLEAERVLEDERIRRLRERRRVRKAQRTQVRKLVLIYAGIMGGMLGCLAAYFGGHNILASALAAIGAGAVALLLYFSED